MSIAGNKNKKSRRGRPQNGSLYSIRVKLWFWAIAYELDVHTAYAVEKHLMPDAFSKSQDGGTIRPCQFDKYMRGEHLPNKSLVDKVESKVPGTKFFFNHPFWTIANKNISIEELYKQLGQLRPEVAGTLFDFPLEKNRVPVRDMRSPNIELELLIADCDFDSLAACLGLIHEINQLSTYQVHYRNTVYDYTLRIFLYSIIELPHCMITHELFEYLRTNFFTLSDNRIWNNKLEDDRIHNDISRCIQIRNLLSHLNIFQYYEYIPAAAVYRADNYLTPSLIKRFMKLINSGQIKKVRRHRVIHNMVRCLKRWEKSNIKSLDPTTLIMVNNKTLVSHYRHHLSMSESSTGHL